MSVYTGITLAVAKGFEGRVGGMGGEGERMCAFSKINCKWGLRKQNRWGGGARFDEHHLSGPVRLHWTPMIN